MNPSLTLTLLALAAGAPQDAPDGQDTEQRLAELERKFEALAGDLETFTLSDLVPAVGEGSRGLGPAASKVYDAADGSVSIGGYGEAEYLSPDEGDAEFDLHRAVLYFGYKFDPRWVFNSEIEFEHAEETAVEFAYVDYLHSEAASFRGGLLLVPMGLVNEVHEPTTFLGASRPLTESWIVPSTWREGGVSVYGAQGGFDYQVAVVNGFDGSGFGGTSGLRGGRQSGGHAAAEDLALVASLDYTDAPGLVVGGSVYTGDSGQGGDGGDLETFIVEAHADYKSGPLWARALVADASVDDRDAGDMDLAGWYAEVGWDVLGDDLERALYPFVRLEGVDTDESAGGVDATVTTFGLHYRPIDSIVIKADFADSDEEALDDRFLITLGWVF